MNLTPDERAELRKLAEAATPRPWRIRPERSSLYWWIEAPKGNHGLLERARDVATVSGKDEPDAAYIVAACNAIPKLLDELEHEASERDAWQERADRTEQCADGLAAQLEALTSPASCASLASCQAITRDYEHFRDRCTELLDERDSLAATVAMLREALLDNAVAVGPDGESLMCGFCHGQPWPTGHDPKCDTGKALADTAGQVAAYQRQEQMKGARKLAERIKASNLRPHQLRIELEAMEREQ